MALVDRLPPTAREPFITRGCASGGWDNLLAIDPVDQFTLRTGDSLDNLHRFCRKHAGRFLAGYLAYELGHQLLNIETRHLNTEGIPLARFNAYENYLRFDSDGATCFHLDDGFPMQVSRMLEHAPNRQPNAPDCSFAVQLDRDSYCRQLNKILDYIRAGDFYQINYTHQMTAASDLSGKALFSGFALTNPVEHAAYWHTNDLEIICLSPESFVKISGDTIITRPIKGTRPRGESSGEDLRLRQELLDSDKEQAELFMITDLLRNDLGKVSQIGSVKVVQLKALQELSRVFHTYSEITGRRRPELSNMETLLSMFPGGSITGCPKKRAMEVIDEIEATPRGIYTGSIGYILPNGDLWFNIAIRTLVKRGRNLTLGVGGGITIESSALEEYEETFAKARSFSTQL